MKQRLRAAGRRCVEWLAPTAVASLSDVPRLRAQLHQVQQRAATAVEHTQTLRNRVKKLENSPQATVSQIRDLQDRVASLEAELQETRQLNRYVAEVTDIVQEVLLPAANRDDERLNQHLTRYSDSF